MVIDDSPFTLLFTRVIVNRNNVFDGIMCHAEFIIDSREYCLPVEVLYPFLVSVRYYDIRQSVFFTEVPYLFPFPITCLPSLMILMWKVLFTILVHLFLTLAILLKDIR
jgi:hypothetical protein